MTGKRQVQFLLKWLTDLVPHEPVYALKVPHPIPLHTRSIEVSSPHTQAHLTLSSSALGVKKKVITDYTDLVRARLSELGVRILKCCFSEVFVSMLRSICFVTEHAQCVSCCTSVGVSESIVI